MPIVVSCSCGQGFAAKDTLGGQHVLCPQCGSVLFVPYAQDALQQVVKPDVSQTPLQPTPAPAQGATKYSLSPQPQQERGRKTGWIIGLCVGGGALLIGVIAVVLVVSLVGREKEVAEKTVELPLVPQEIPQNTADPPLLYPPRPQLSPQPALNRDNAPLVSGSGAFAPPADPVPMPTVNRQIDPPMNTQPTAALPMTLDRAATAWYRDPNSKLRGMRLVKDTKLEFYQYSWMVDLLPHLGHQRLFEKINFGRPWYAPGNDAVAITVIPEFLNPADSRRVWEEPTHEGAALTHFVGMSGVEDGRNVVAASLPRSDPRAGVFGYDRAASAAEITDGTSQTIMVIGAGEIVGPWIGGGGFTVRGARKPYFIGDNQPIGFGTQGLPQPGAAVLMADGSVRHLSAEMDPHVFRALSTIHGGESVDQQQIGREMPHFPIK